MKSIPLSSLVPGAYFDEPVFLDGDYILLTPDSPVTPELLKRLQKWRYLAVATDGNSKDAPSYLSGAGSAGGAPQTFDEGIQQNEQVDRIRSAVGKSLLDAPRRAQPFGSIARSVERDLSIRSVPPLPYVAPDGLLSTFVDQIARWRAVHVRYQCKVSLGPAS